MSSRERDSAGVSRVGCPIATAIELSGCELRRRVTVGGREAVPRVIELSSQGLRSEANLRPLIEQRQLYRDEFERAVASRRR